MDEPEDRGDAVSRSAGDDAAEAAAARLGADEQRLQECRVALADGDLDVASFNAVRRRLEPRIEEAGRTLARRSGRAVLLDLPATGELLHRAWDEATLERKRALVDVVIDKVLVGPQPVRGYGRFDPSRVGIVERHA